MIVSGFTQKNVKEEHTHGSSLDHAHCVTCVNRACKVTANSITSCDVIDCPRGCHHRYHCCKENEHVLLCSEERVACINSLFGCRVVVHRRKLADHLRNCPASIVHCRAEWNRLDIEPLKQREEHSVLMKKTYAHCGQLDTALAMRDHRILVDRLLDPQRTSTHTPSLLTEPHPAASAGPPAPSTSDLDVAIDLLDRWDSKFLLWKKKKARSDEPSQPVSPPPSASDSGSGQTELVEMETEGRGTAEKEAGASCQDQPDGKREKRRALRDVLSVGMTVECMARCLPKPRNTHTFLCAQDVRRAEFPHHFHSVHDRIQSDLGGWMEQRCPLAYLGCPFSFRRFRPGQPGMTLHHSWLLESFGVTTQSLQADFSHQTPSRLLPVFAETADDQDMCPEDGDQLQASDNLPLSKPVGHSQAELSPRSLSALTTNQSFNGKSEEVQREIMPGMHLSNAESLVETGETSDKASLSDPGCLGRVQDPQPAADSDSFVSLPNSISLGEDDACRASDSNDSQVKQFQGSPAHLKSVSGQMRQVSNQESHVVDAAGVECVQNLCDQDERKKSSALPPSQHPEPSISGSPQRTSQNQSFRSPDASFLKENQVMYTGLGPNSCIRVDTVSFLSERRREVKKSLPTLFLEHLPSEIVRHISQFLDSFSLYNLSLVSHAMRDLCCTLLQDRGMVSLVWGKQQMGDKAVWRIVGKRWRFSTCFDPVESWSFAGPNPIASHLLACPYNQDRVVHTDKFSIISLCETPLSIQIRDMLRQLLQRRRFLFT